MGAVKTGRYSDSNKFEQLNHSIFVSSDRRFSLSAATLYWCFLLQEFITRGANDADVATVYESAAIYRWQQAATTQGKPYQIYYLNPTVETISTAAIIRPNVDAGTESAATKFLDFLTQPEQQAVFVQYGFRPVNSSVDLTTVPNSPWSKNIPGVEAKPTQQIIPPPNNSILADIQRLWERGN